jgi:nucleotide-binding universal stress UspA family protein
MNIEHIVVGTDFSPEAEVATKHALHVARLTGADITLVHACAIVEPPSSSVSGPWTELMQRQLAENRDRLEAMRVAMSGPDRVVSHLLVDDVPDTAIIDVATRLGADLVVVGTHGFTGIKHLLLGSIAEKVLRHSRTSVMIARGSEAGRGAPGLGYGHILVPTDFSESSEQALDMAISLAAEGASIEVWHWWNSPYGGPLPDPEALRREIESEVRAAGEELLRRHRDPGERSRYRLSFHVAEAPAKYGIQDQLAGGDYDLVVMGSHGRRGLARWLLGSVAEATARHAPCPVLLARRPASDDSAVVAPAARENFSRPPELASHHSTR